MRLTDEKGVVYEIPALFNDIIAAYRVEETQLTLPPKFQAAVDAGVITHEQAEELWQLEEGVHPTLEREPVADAIPIPAAKCTHQHQRYNKQAKRVECLNCNKVIIGNCGVLNDKVQVTAPMGLDAAAPPPPMGYFRGELT